MSESKFKIWTTRHDGVSVGFHEETDLEKVLLPKIRKKPPQSFDIDPIEIVDSNGIWGIKQTDIGNGNLHYIYHIDDCFTYYDAKITIPTKGIPRAEKDGENITVKFEEYGNPTLSLCNVKYCNEKFGNYTPYIADGLGGKEALKITNKTFPDFESALEKIKSIFPHQKIEDSETGKIIGEKCDTEMYSYLPLIQVRWSFKPSGIEINIDFKIYKNFTHRRNSIQELKDKSLDKTPPISLGDRLIGFYTPELNFELISQVRNTLTEEYGLEEILPHERVPVYHNTEWYLYTLFPRFWHLADCMEWIEEIGNTIKKRLTNYERTIVYKRMSKKSTKNKSL